MKTRSIRNVHQSGIVLPVVLVVLVVVTTLVLTQVRRGTVDERLAANWSRVISGETAAESTLRWCEMEVRGEPRFYDLVVLAADHVATPSWRSNLWNQPDSILTIDANLRPPGATSAACIVENATEELGCNSTQGQDDMGGTGCRSPYFRKYRITAQVIFPDATALGNVVYRSQSEVRLTISGS
jgi:hypothetical protein